MGNYEDLSAASRNLITRSAFEDLIRNGRFRDEDDSGEAVCADFDSFNPLPVLMLFSSPAVWLLTDMASEDPDVVFGLFDLGANYPEIGYERLSRLIAAFPDLTCSQNFRARAPLHAYIDASRKAGYVRHPQRGREDDLDYVPHARVAT